MGTDGAPLTSTSWDSVATPPGLLAVHVYTPSRDWLTMARVNDPLRWMVAELRGGRGG